MATAIPGAFQARNAASARASTFETSTLETAEDDCAGTRRTSSRRAMKSERIHCKIPTTRMNHEVLNQPPPLVDYNLFATDRALREAVAREGAGWACQRLLEYGRRAGSAEAIEWGVLANQNPPVLHTHDRFGHRRDEVEFHPAWHHLMRLAVQYGIP